MKKTLLYASGLLLGAWVGTLLSFATDFGLPISIHHIQLNSDIFWNQYFVGICWLVLFTIIFLIVNLIAQGLAVRQVHMNGGAEPLP